MYVLRFILTDNNITIYGLDIQMKTFIKFLRIIKNTKILKSAAWSNKNTNSNYLTFN